MEKSAFRIVFMGTPDFASGILKELLEQNFNVVGVITAPDKPAGRGQKLHQSSVKQFALNHNIQVLQPTNLKDEDFIQHLRSIDAHLFVVVAFRMLPEVVWSMPSFGTINLHASLLPEYRGSAPINWAIINGETKTGVTTFFIEKEIDTGNVIDQIAVEITEEMNVGDLHDLLLSAGAALICNTIDKIRLNNAVGIPQTEMIKSDLKTAPKIFKQDCRVTFKKTAKKIHDLIRGLSPYPAAWTKVKMQDGSSKQFKLYRSHITNLPVKEDLSILHDLNGLLFPCEDYYLLITELQPEGKRRMHYKEFLAGNRLENGKIDLD
jgi:methionyl-tRNA formyltransferase